MYRQFELMDKTHNSGTEGIINIDEKKTYTEGGFKKFRDIRGWINGDFPFYPERVVGKTAEDLFTLTDEDVCNTLLMDMVEPIKVSMKAVKNRNTKEISFEIEIRELSDLYEVVVKKLHRSKLKHLDSWVDREIGGFQGVNEAVKCYLSQAIGTLAPILEKRAFEYYENDSILELYGQICREIINRAANRTGYQDPAYQVNYIQGEGKFVCIRSKTDFQNLLTSIHSEHTRIEVLKKLEAWDGSSMLLTNSGRQYSFQFNGNWWYFIRYDEEIIRKCGGQDLD